MPFRLRDGPLTSVGRSRRSTATVVRLRAWDRSLDPAVLEERSVTLANSKPLWIGPRMARREPAIGGTSEAVWSHSAARCHDGLLGPVELGRRDADRLCIFLDLCTCRSVPSLVLE